MKRFLALLFGCAFASCVYGLDDTPPAPQREFRGLWVATVNNVDWPSKPGLSTHDQQAELLAILDRSVALHLNAIILQVRPDCDAFYDSKIEPWSEYITGVMGRAPSPYYDPLEFAVAAAHKRGLELHAWFNPFRVRSLDMKTPVSPDFVSRRRPEIVRHYGQYLWLDPAERDARAYALSVVMDVVHRYDIDGVHFDDYFYPYHEKAGTRELDFPDETTWAKYQASGGKLSRNDWRRDNINQFIQTVYLSIKADKPWVKFGVSPFGIWRPKFPPQIRGFDSFDELYSDSRHWLRNGWVDYLSPQLYWPVASQEQNFGALLKWWAEENIRRRHLWPGMKVSDWRSVTDGNGRETVREVETTRHQAGATGDILWHAKPLMQNLAGVADFLGREVYTKTALIPASPWMNSTNPPAPTLIVKSTERVVRMKWKPGANSTPWLWVLNKKIGGHWIIEIFPADIREHSFLTPDLASHPSLLALAAVDRCGNLSAWSFGNEAVATPAGFSQ
jgi:uncharacterized lipoprotein YddW (UPF0748 family)